MSAGRPALLAICALGFFCVGCNSSVEREGTGKLIGWSRMPLEHARFFQLWEKGTDRALVTFGPGGERDTTGMHFIVNIQQPDHPAGSTLLGAEVSRIALSSTTLAPFVLLLGQEEAIAGCAHADMLKAPALDRTRESRNVAGAGPWRWAGPRTIGVAERASAVHGPVQRQCYKRHGFHASPVRSGGVLGTGSIGPGGVDQGIRCRFGQKCLCGQRLCGYYNALPSKQQRLFQKIRNVRQCSSGALGGVYGPCLRGTATWPS
jgi:hypothetical protein